MEDRDKPVARVQLEELEIKLNKTIQKLEIKCDREIMTVSYSTSQDLLALEQRCMDYADSSINDLHKEVEALKEERKANRSWWQIW